MACQKSAGALKIKQTIRDASGLHLNDRVWHLHTLPGGDDATPVFADKDDAYTAAEKMLTSLGVDPSTGPHPLLDGIRSGDIAITVKQEWVMRNFDEIRADYLIAPKAKPAQPSTPKPTPPPPSPSVDDHPRDSLGRPVARRANYSGYRVSDPAQTLQDLERQGVTPAFDRLILEHVTHTFPDKTTAPPAQSVRIVGVAEGDGVQALLVEVDGSTARPDGGLFHVTFSLAEGVKPFASNALLAEGEIRPLAEPVDVKFEAF